MKHFQHKEFITQINSIASQFISDDSILFDIETTGFAKNSCIIYLIGTLRKEGDYILIDQFLAESKSDEELILQSFASMMESHKTYITFNGVRFDVPFVQERLKHYGLVDCFYHKKSFDIYLSHAIIIYVLSWGSDILNRFSIYREWWFRYVLIVFGSLALTFSWDQVKIRYGAATRNNRH